VLLLVELCAPTSLALPLLTLAGLLLLTASPAGRRVLHASSHKAIGILMRSRWHFGLVLVALEVWIGRTQLPTEAPALYAAELLTLLLWGAALAWWATRRFERINCAVVAFLMPGRAIRLGQCSSWWGGFGGLCYEGQGDALGARLRDAFVAAIEDAARRWPNRELELSTHAWVARRVVAQPRVVRHYEATLEVAADARISLTGEILSLAAWSDILYGSPELLRRLERRHRRIRIQLVPRSA
jgi:hypothetical protein